MEHLIPQDIPPRAHYAWPTYSDNHADYPDPVYHVAPNVAADHCIPSHYQTQHPQYGLDLHDSYVMTQNEAAQHTHAQLSPSDAMSYWPAEQVPTAGSPMSAASSTDAQVYYAHACYGNHDVALAENHHHGAAVESYPSNLHTVYPASYGTAGYLYDDPAVSPPLVAPNHANIIPAHTLHPTVAQDQGESGHDPAQHDANNSHAPAYEGVATAFPASNSYPSGQMEMFENQYNIPTGTAPPRHYAPVLAKEEQQPYVAVAAPAPQYAAPAPAPAPPPAPVTPAALTPESSAEPPSLPLRGGSPMGHLPYPEEVAKAELVQTAGRQSRQSSVFSTRARSPTPSPTPQPQSPVMTTLTFITYPETEPRGHGRGADCDEHDGDDDSGSPSRRGRRGKKQPKKEPFLACYFCRGRKIACHPKVEGSEDRTCTQCAKRHIPCEYPLTSRRGQRKPQDAAGASTSDAPAREGSARPRARPQSNRSGSSLSR